VSEDTADEKNGEGLASALQSRKKKYKTREQETAISGEYEGKFQKFPKSEREYLSPRGFWGEVRCDQKFCRCNAR